MICEVICIDASVGIKWYNQKEIHAEKALKIREEYINDEIDIAVPDIFFYEVINALRYNPEFRQKDIESAISSLKEMQLITVNHDLFLDKIPKIAFDYDITVYDASYVAMAKEKNQIFYTADEKLLKKVDLDFVKHLKEF
jgi:predicted nucleic acid-binding protein